MLTRMVNTLLRPLLAPALCAALAACAASEFAAEWESRTAALHVSAVETDASKSLLSGFDPLGTAQRSSPYDRLLYRLTLETPGGIETWHLLFTHLPAEVVKLDNGTHIERVSYGALRVTIDGQPTDYPYDSRIRVDIFDGAAKPLASTTVDAPGALLANGLVTGNRADATAAQSREAWTTLIAMVAILRKDDVLEDILFRIVDVDWLSIVFHFGANIELATELAREFDGRDLGLTDGWRGAALDIPLNVRVNGTPSVACSLRVVEPFAPLAVGAGIVSIAGFRAADERVRFRFELVAARRGDLEPPVTPDHETPLLPVAPGAPRAK